MAELQVVDISTIDKQTGDTLLSAASNQGFLFIKGHNFTNAEIELIFSLSKDYFDLPSTVKQQNPISNNVGYSFSENLSSSNLDCKEILNFDVFGFFNGNPNNLPEFWEKGNFDFLNNVIRKLNDLALKLLQLLALSLDLDIDWFTRLYDPLLPSGSTFRLLHYPGGKNGENRLKYFENNDEPVEIGSDELKIGESGESGESAELGAEGNENDADSDLNVRAGAHTDYGSMTLLFQQQEGLEILTDSWHPVPIIGSKNDEPSPILVNIGDQLNYWTNGLLKSTIHRVKFNNTAIDRYSVAFFSHPSDDTILKPVPSAKIKQSSIKTLITAKQHLENKLRSTYS